MYVQPESKFASTPETQSEYTQKFLNHIAKVGSIEPLNLFPDELQKVFLYEGRMRKYKENERNDL